MNATRAAQKRPQIHMIESEADKLSDLALGAEVRFPAVCEMLLDEISRAKMHSERSIPADVVTMGSTVEFIDEGTGVSRKVTLVYPPEADIEAGKVSILTPVGAGLIGLRTGQSIVWPDRDGRERRLAIVQVERAA